MTPRLRREAGFTLIELLLVLSLTLVITGASLQAFNVFERGTARSQKLNENVEQSRNGLDVLSRQLRNLAKRFYPNQAVVVRAAPNDLIFQTSDPGKKWVRYCLDTTYFGNGTYAALRMAQSTSDIPTWMLSAGCGDGWPANAGTVVAQNVVNQTVTPYPQSVFTYRCADAKPAGCPATAADYGSIKTVGAQLLVDQNVSSRPLPQRVATAVYMRNQNEPPVAPPFASRLLPTTNQVVLNASAATDPEGRSLRFFWFLGDAPAFTCDAPPPTEQILSRSVVYTHTFDPPGVPASFSYAVCDPGELRAVSTTQQVSP